MGSIDDQIRSLKAALDVSPDNVPLRVHLADLLAQYGRHAEAQTEYREALSMAPDDDELKLKLAGSFFESGQRSHAHVIVESLLRQDATPGAAYLLHCRLLLSEGEVDRAVRAYRRALDDDPDLEDPALSERLGIGALEDDDAEVVEGRVRQRDGGEALPGAEMERPKMAFADVGGMHDLKEEISMKIIKPLLHPELFEAYGKAIGGGILMYGPPGCGKTHLARATAGEVKARFISVGISDVLDMWIGQSERNLHAIFEQARENTPCVMFFDEVDALGAKRTDMRQSAGRQLINQFLAELDGIEKKNDGVLVLAATNAPWHLDSAFRRPGRFDRILFVPPPDEEARAAIVTLHLRGKPTEAIDAEHVARKTKGFSGADLKAVVDQAVEAKLHEALKAGTPKPLTTKDLIKAARKVRPSTKDWFATARNYAMYANQSGLYDDVLKHMDGK